MFDKLSFPILPTPELKKVHFLLPMRNHPLVGISECFWLDIDKWRFVIYRLVISNHTTLPARSAAVGEDRVGSYPPVAICLTVMPTIRYKSLRLGAVMRPNEAHHFPRQRQTHSPSPRGITVVFREVRQKYAARMAGMKWYWRAGHAELRFTDWFHPTAYQILPELTSIISYWRAVFCRLN